MPRVTGLCGSSAVSHLAWCLRCTATHCLVTVLVVSHSQKRKKCEGIACNSSARCACERCRKMVVDAMVMCVTMRVKARTCQPLASVQPLIAHCTMLSCSDAQNPKSNIQYLSRTGDCRGLHASAFNPGQETPDSLGHCSGVRPGQPPATGCRAQIRTECPNIFELAAIPSHSGGHRGPDLILQQRCQRPAIGMGGSLQRQDLHMHHQPPRSHHPPQGLQQAGVADVGGQRADHMFGIGVTQRSEEHTSELQSQSNLVCRL